MNDFIDRELEAEVKRSAGWFPVVSLTGPRQSGKSTLVRHAFPDYSYVTLEDPQARRAAIDDPVSFIRNRGGHLIIDEAQYAPDLFSMIQVVSDERGNPGQYVLTGSQNFLMMKSIGQSLAGRVGLLKLLPLSFRELGGDRSGADGELAGNRPSDDGEPGSNWSSVEDFALKGGYPRLRVTGMPTATFFSSYVDTYVERDVAGFLDVRSKEAFRKLLAICALNVGSLLNVSAISRDTGVSVPTIKNWLSILESSYLLFTLRPFSSNGRKRLTKSPKLYFYDTGLLCHLLGIRTVDQLVDAPSFGAVFENLIVAEAMKRHLNGGERPELFFYRDDSKREIDLLDFTDLGHPQAVEVKSSRTYHDKYARHLTAVCDELGIEREDRFVVARVESTFESGACRVASAEDWLMQR